MRLGCSAVGRTVLRIPIGAVRLLVFVIVLASVSSAAAQQAQIFYVYDDLNRLSAVVDQQGNVAVYTYDAVGNILKIERFDAASIPGAVGISYFTPSVGHTGTVVQIFGKGFGAAPAQDAVAFNGAPASVTSAAPNRLVASVPAGATTGPISVSSPAGSATSATAFTVIGALAIAPTAGEVQVGLTRQFTATEGGTLTTNVTWAVNSVLGGTPTVGTISTSGLYTAPATIPVPPAVTITATDKDDPSSTASAGITILAAGPRYGASQALSLTVAPTAPAVVQSITSSVSARFATPSPTAFADGAPLSVAIAPFGSASAVTPLLSLSMEPVITAVAPASASSGSTVTVTLTGAGLTGASDVAFLRNNVADAAITVTGITPSADGTTVAVSATIAAGAASGGRVVEVTTADGHSSTAAPTSGNIFTVQ